MNNKTLKMLTALLFSIIILVGVGTVVYAADSSVTYEGGAEEFVFLPGSSYTDSDLFDNFKGLMPGDTVEQIIEVKNNSSSSDTVKIYIRAILHDEDSNLLSSEVAASGETVATMHDFLSKLTMTVWQDNTAIYQASPDLLDGFADNVLLGTFNYGESTTLRVELLVPIELDNKYANRVGEVDWVFVAEEIDNPKPPVPPPVKPPIIVPPIVVTPGPAFVTLTANKILNGEEPVGSDFTFLLTDAAGNVIDTQKNRDGVIVFNTLTYNQTGRYIYYISEKAGNNPNITYDTTTYKVTVSVTISGNYDATVKYEKDGKTYLGIPEFTNRMDEEIVVAEIKPEVTTPPAEPEIVTEPSPEPEPEPIVKEVESEQTPTPTPDEPAISVGGGPQTGDNTNSIIWIVLLVIGIAAILSVVIFGRKKTKKALRYY